jgi:hypothetical protein
MRKPIPQSIDLEAGLRVPLLRDELTKRESIVHNLSTAYTWLVYDASVLCDTLCGLYVTMTIDPFRKCLLWYEKRV